MTRGKTATANGSGRDLLRLGNDPYWFPLFLLALTDAAVFAGSIWLSFPLRFHSFITDWFPLREGWVAPPFSVFFHFGWLAAVVGLLTFERLGFYQSRIGTDRRVHVLRIAIGALIVSLVLQGFLSLFDIQLSRGARLIAFCLTVPLAIGAHYCLKSAFAQMRTQGLGYRRTLLVTDNLEEVEERILEIEAERGTEFHVTGILVGTADEKWRDAGGLSQPSVAEIVGNLKDLRRTLARKQYDVVVIRMTPEHADGAEQSIEICAAFEVDYYVDSGLFDALLDRSQVGGAFLLPVLSLGETPLSGSAIVMKRIFDLLGSAGLILVSFPFWVVFAALIKLESRGPVFYRQERIGADGRSFDILKFRSMRLDAEASTGPVWATREDPRRTRFGTFLREWNIDETPQFINVFRGEMSLVGPRPERPHFVNQFKEDIPRYMRRHMVKSGITGWAQVNGFRGDTSIEGRTQYDIWYIENWSFRLDLKILLRTLFARENAY